MAGKPDPVTPQPGSGDAARIRKDAKGQFAPKKHGGRNSGLHSAAPVATSGDGDATFDEDPKDRGSDGR